MRDFSAGAVRTATWQRTALAVTIAAATLLAFMGLAVSTVAAETPVQVAPADAAASETSWAAGTVVTPARTGRGVLATLSVSDHRAALEAVQVALTQVADGSAFVWRRERGTLRGFVRPTGSFRSADGRICRHIVIRLAVGVVKRQAEGIACRNTSGAWTLSG